MTEKEKGGLSPPFLLLHLGSLSPRNLCHFIEGLKISGNLVDDFVNRAIGIRLINNTTGLVITT